MAPSINIWLDLVYRDIFMVKGPEFFNSFWCSSGRYGLTMANFAGTEVTCGISAIAHELRFFHDAAIVIGGVIGGDEHAVVLIQILQRCALHPQLIPSPASHEWKVRIVVADFGARFSQQLDDCERGRFAQVVNIFLVGHAQHQYACALERLLASVECRGYRRDYVVWHRGVDFARKLDKTSMKVELL